MIAGGSWRNRRRRRCEKTSTDSFMDFDEIRARIIELNLPESLEKLGSQAFSGLTRLRKITIPTNIKKIDFSESPFRNNSRLQEIVFLGLESITYYEYPNPNNPFHSKEITRSLSSDPQLFKSELIEIIKKDCPNLIRVHIPHLEKIQHELAILNQYNQLLRDSILNFNEKLSSHTFFFSSKTQADLTQLSLSKYQLGKHLMGTSYLKKAYEDKLTSIRTDFDKINSSMEELCKTNAPEHYAKIYCRLHPEFAAKVDSVHHRYRCKYETIQIALKLLAEDDINEPECLETQYLLYLNLFSSHKEFLQVYDSLSSEQFDEEIISRFHKMLESEMYHTLNFKNAAINNNLETAKILTLYKNLKDNYNLSADELVNKNYKMFAEYNKTVNYWNSTDNFFEAYISGDYKNILKAKKSGTLNKSKSKLSYFSLLAILPAAYGAYYIYKSTAK